MKHGYLIQLIVILFLFVGGDYWVSAQNVPKIMLVPESLPYQEQAYLNEQRSVLVKEANNIRMQINRHNQKCTGVDENSALAEVCSKEQFFLENKIKTYIDKVTTYNNKTVNTIATFMSGEETSPNIMPLSAANLVNILTKVSSKLKLPKGGRHEDQSLNCSRYFHGVGEELRLGGFPASSDAWRTSNANAIADEIELNKNGHWQEVNQDNVQTLANAGVIIVAIKKSADNGHVAIAFPLTPEVRESEFSGTGPFVKDGNEHYLKREKRLYASTWGAVKASKAFSYDSTPPKWYIWLPSISKP